MENKTRVKIGRNVKVDPSSSIGEGVVIGNNVHIAKGAVIRDNVKIGSGTYIDEYAIIGEHLFKRYNTKNYKNPTTKIGAHSVVRSYSIIYAGCLIQEGLLTGHHSVIREYCIIGRNCKFGTASQADGYVRIGDNCQLHSNVFLASYTVLKNHVIFYPYATTLDSLHPPCKECRKGPVIDDYVVVSAAALILPRVKIGRDALIAGGAVVTKDVLKNTLVAGLPAKAMYEASLIGCKIGKVRQPYPWIKNVAKRKNK